jgi:pimeloyl-ACP methyl ester carboxylesterase
MRKTLVMIPAFGCDGRLYGPQVAALQTAFDVRIVIATADRYSGMVAEVLQQAPGPFLILGTSMGGRLALEVALAAPARVLGLCIIGAGPGAVADQAAGLRRSTRIRAGEKDEVVAEMAAMIAHMPGPRGPATRQAFVDMAHDIDVAALARQSDALAYREERRGRISAIACPTLCLWGEHDAFSPAADGRHLAAGVQQGRFVALPECGHFPTLEYPEESLGVLAAWLHDAVHAASA